MISLAEKSPSILQVRKSRVVNHHPGPIAQANLAGSKLQDIFQINLACATIKWLGLTGGWFPPDLQYINGEIKLSYDRLLTM